MDPVSSENAVVMTPEALLDRLAALTIAYTLHHHQPVFTVAESHTIEGKMILVSAANETKIDLKKLEDVVGCGRLSFGSPERLWAHLGVRPGSVCPYAIINDTNGVVRIILDAYMMQGDLVNFHPLINTMTIAVAPKDLVKFIESTGHVPEIVDFSKM